MTGYRVLRRSIRILMLGGVMATGLAWAAVEPEAAAAEICIEA